MKKFILKKGEKVFVTIKSPEGKETTGATIKSFSVVGIFYEDHPVFWHHYSNGLFYGFGYHSDGFAIVTKKKWHIKPALIVEKIRLVLPVKISKKLGLDR